MTFDEQIRVEELNGLSAEDERQVYTKLVCISFENRNGDADDTLDSHSYSECSNFENLNTLNGRMLENGCNLVETKNILHSPLSILRMNLKRPHLGRCPVIPAKDVRVRRAFSVPSLVTSPRGLPAIASNVRFSSAPQVKHDSDSNKDDWSESSTISIFDANNGVISEDFFAPLPSKRRHSLKRYLVIFLGMITLLSITLLVLCSQVTPPGRSHHPSLFKPTPLTQDNLLQLQNGNLIHYVGAKFMAPATEQEVSQYLHMKHVKY